ncbi:MAG: D-sedoheptulose 7-phosphate isomerase [Candidatus Hatepunaea meridiana]|nr:D-sedoheptulose 7-phosphate isomerase [Candidatus Hatepunaea meridiana]
MDHNYLKSILQDQIDAHQHLMSQSTDVILKIAETIANAIRNGQKVLLFGNGGSAADAQHVAAELVGRFARERNAWPAISLTTDTSILTAIGNDYGFENVFSRQVEALAGEGDIVVGISTSGKSPNVLKGIEAGKKVNAVIIGFTGGSGGVMSELCDICFVAPAENTARIQELHIAVWHAVCELVEMEL